MVGTTKAFFEEYLPQALSAGEDAEGTLSFAIAGAGEWTVNLAQRAVTPKFDAKADFTLRMSVADFEDMAAGTLDLDAAVAAGRVEAAGDVKLFGAFGIFLEPEAE